MSIAKTLSLLSVCILLFAAQSQAGITQNTEADQMMSITDHLEELSTSQHYTQLTANQNVPTINQKIVFDIAELKKAISSTETATLSLKNQNILNQPGFPLLPMKTYTFNFPLDTTIQSISIKDPIIQELSNNIDFEITPQPHFYSLNTTPLELNSQQIVLENLKSYQENHLYPGTTHSIIIGENATNTNLIVHYYPLQTNLSSKRNYVISDATIEIIYTTEESSTQNPLPTNPENIIITHPDFLSEANQLADFHTNQGISSEVVTTDWIDQNMQESDSPPIMGYKDFKLKDRLLRYDEQLALKIITYMKTQQNNPNLKYVTIIGNAIHVPPSYYFGQTFYPVPTDFYYCSPDLDLIPNYRIGRLPVHTADEAESVVSKIMEWKPTSEQMNNVAIAGGIPFNSPYYIGELITIDSANRGFFDGFSLQKLYRTDDSFHDTDVLSALQSDIGLLYMICHGNADVVAVEEGRISTNTLEDQPKNTNAPILSCIACSSGAYDTYIIRQGYDLERTSVGEAFSIFEGGAIAYIGGSRTNDGFPIFTLEKGRVQISKETYMAGLLTSVSEAYHNNAQTLGDLCMYASEQYLVENDMTDFWNQYHYMGFILLGDPALALPNRTFDQESYQLPSTEVQNPLGYLDYDDYDYNGTIILSAINEETTYLCSTNSSSLSLKSIETGNYEGVVDVDLSSHATVNNSSTISHMMDASELTLLRFIGEDGKEDWMYSQPIRPIDDDFSTQTEGFGVTRWNSLSDALLAAEQGDTLYLFNGSYQESVTVQTKHEIVGQDKSSTILDGAGIGSVLEINSDGVTIRGLSIINSGGRRDDAALVINPKNKLNSEPILIIDSVFSDSQNGIFISSGLSLFSPQINIIDNIVENNEFGITIKNSKSEKIIVGNLIQNNRVGMSFKHVKQATIQNNDFIENTRHCRIIDLEKSSFEANYWDNWIGVRLNMNLPIPKIINGISATRLRVLSQIKFDWHPSSEKFN